MSAEHDSCYLCASDEGILLDIFGDAGQTLRENIEACLKVKIQRRDALSGKICHKCAYELDSCGRFLGKYKRLKDSRKQRVSAEPGGCCCLCGEEGKKVRLLEINGGNSLKNSLRKIGQAFDKDFFEDRIIERLCVCLGCRYNVDVLSDLKNIYRGRPIKMKSADKNGVTLNLPKTRTRVVSRKTTYIPQPKLNRDPDCDSNASVSSSDASSSRKRGRPSRHKEVISTSRTTKTSSHFRTCEECETMVEHGVDMYRYHRTGLTVCKDCWLTMDPERISNRKAKKLARAGSETSTKLCAVFLKDVLSNPAKYSNIYRIERDKHGNATFLITDESSENEDREKKSDSIAGLEGSSAGKRKRPTKRLPVDSAKTEDVGRPKRARPAMRRSQEPAESPRIVAVAKTRNGTQSDSGRTRMTRSKRGSSESTTNSESWVNGGRGTRAKRSNRDEESANKAQRIESSIATRSGRTIKSVSPVARLGRPRKGTRAKKVPDSSTSRATPPPVSSTAGSPDRTSDESIPSSEHPGETLAGGDEANVPLEDARKTTRSDSETEKPYSCSVCRVVCINKLDGKSHELTHEKQPEVKLRRVVVPSLETIDEISSVQEAAEQSRGASDPAESTDRTEDHPAMLTAAIEEESTVHSIVLPTIEDKHNSGERNDDQQRDNEEDQQSQQPSNEAEAIRVEASAKSTVAAEEKKEEGEKNAVQEQEEVEGAGEPMRVSEVDEDEDKTRTDVGEGSGVTESPETRDESATVEDESEKRELKRDENRVESNKSPEVSQRGEPRDPEELGSDKQRTEPETEPIIKDSAQEDLHEENNGVVIGTPTDSSPGKDVSTTEPEERLVDDNGPNGDIDSVENEKKKVVSDEEPELASLKVVDEEDEESELAPLKVIDEEEKQLESAPSTVPEKLAEAEEKESEVISSVVPEEMVEAEEEEAESSSLKMEEKVMEVKEHEKPESSSSTVQEKVLTAEEEEPESASLKVADKLVVEEGEEENEEKKKAEKGKEEAEREEEEKKEEGEEENEVEEEEKEVEEKEIEEKEVDKEKEVRDEKQDEKEENEEEEEKEVGERRRIVDPNEEEKPSTEVMFREVFDLANDEVKKRLENGDRNNERLATPAETLENISLEIQKSADMSEVDEESTAIGGS